MATRRLALILLLMITVCWCNGSSISVLEDEIISYLGENNYKSTAVGVMVEGKLVYVKGFTLSAGSDLGGDPMKLWPIGKLSESITALAVMKLVQDGDLAITEKVFGPKGVLYDLQSYRAEADVDKRVYDITVNDLLSHTSGWDFGVAPLFDPNLNTQYLKKGIKVTDIRDELGTVGPLTTRHIIRYMLSKPLKHQPGTWASESVFHYGVLAEIIEEISGLDYRKYVKKYILELCGMWNTHLGPEHVPSTPADFDTTAAALGWFSNVFDMLRMMKCIDGSGRFRDLDGKTVKVMGAKDEEGQELKTWHGLGFMANDHHAMWQVMDGSHHNAILWHSNMQAAEEEHHAKQMSFVFLFESTNGLNSVNKHKLSKIIRAVDAWPKENAFTTDLSDIPKLHDGTLFKLSVPERHMKAYANALKAEYHDITWVSAAHNSTSTEFTVVSKPNPAGENYILECGLTDSELKDHRELLQDYKYELKFLHSYMSSSHDGKHRFLAISTKVAVMSGVVLGLEADTAKYKSLFAEYIAKDLVPMVQSITHSHGDISNNFIFTKKTNDNYKAYINMHLENIEDTIEHNNVEKRVLTYLDVTHINGVPTFSAVFGETPHTVGTFLKGQSPEEVIAAINANRRLNMVPAVVVGYRVDGKDPIKYVLYVTAMSNTT